MNSGWLAFLVLKIYSAKNWGLICLSLVNMKIKLHTDSGRHLPIFFTTAITISSEPKMLNENIHKVALSEISLNEDSYFLKMLINLFDVAFVFFINFF